MGRKERTAIIKQIEELRGSRVITYICSDRRNGNAKMSYDAVREMYSHIRAIGCCKRLDLYLYSRGGQVDVPWPLVAMLREYCDELGVIIPFHAHSAATMIALACDEIVMGPKAELGPIDPAYDVEIRDKGGAIIGVDTVRVEDVMAYVDFLKKKTSDDTVNEGTMLLAKNIGPSLLGKLHRTHSHIRTVARDLLALRKQEANEDKTDKIVKALAEDTQSHGHAITRKEAENLGLPIAKPDPNLEAAMWSLLELYEADADMLVPVDPEVLIGNEESRDVDLTLAWIESGKKTSVYRDTLRLHRPRTPVSPLEIKAAFSINFSVDLPLPAGVEENPIPQDVIDGMKQEMEIKLAGQAGQLLGKELQQQLQGEILKQITEQVRKQSPAEPIRCTRFGGYWRDETAENI